MTFSEYKNRNNLLNLDFLKSEAKSVHAFGLGFIQLKLSEHHRLHFYCPEVTLTVGEEDVHDHRYGFKSEVIKGSLENSLFVLDFSQNTHLLREESCNPNRPVENKDNIICGLNELGQFTTLAGSTYSLSKDTLHRVETKRAITFLTREVPTKDAARVVIKANGPVICPFSVNLNEEELWRLIAREIHNAY